MERIHKEELPFAGEEEEGAAQVGVAVETQQNPVEELDQAENGGAIAPREQIGGNPLNDDVSDNDSQLVLLLLSSLILNAHLL